MESTLAVENINNGEIEDEIDSCTDDKVCVYEAVISGGYIKQEPYDTEDEPGNIHNYVDIKDDKVCVGGYVKEDQCDTTGQPRNHHNYATIKDEIIEDLTVVKQDIGCATNIKGNNLTRCEGCGEEYVLYCLKCPMLIRIFNSNNPDLDDISDRRTLPKNFVDMCETQSGVGIVALRAIPKGVVFGPFAGLDLTKDDALSKWVSKNKESDYTKDCKWLNWMRYIRRVDRSSHPNLTPFQYEDGLYYRSDCHISVGDELLVCCDSDREESATLDSCFKPLICESLDDVYACTLCCVGYKSICHLTAHNSRCPEKRDGNDFCKEIIQCAFCKIYVDKEEYSGYHLDRCCKSNGRVCPVQQKKQSEMEPIDCQLPYHEDVKPFACTQCPFRTKTNEQLKRHIARHSDDKPFGCARCPFKTKTIRQLKLHMVKHNDDKPFGCLQCLFKTKTSQHLSRHMATHSDDKPFACAQCPFKTKTYRLLKQHLAIHTDAKPFACSLCPYKTKTQAQLKLHNVVHSDDRPFACTHCFFKSKTSKHLKRHIAIHNSDKGTNKIYTSVPRKVRNVISKSKTKRALEIT